MSHQSQLEDELQSLDKAYRTKKAKYEESNSSFLDQMAELKNKCNTERHDLHKVRLLCFLEYGFYILYFIAIT